MRTLESQEKRHFPKSMLTLLLRLLTSEQMSVMIKHHNEIALRPIGCLQINARRNLICFRYLGFLYQCLLHNSVMSQHLNVKRGRKQGALVTHGVNLQTVFKERKKICEKSKFLQLILGFLSLSSVYTHFNTLK